MRFLVLSIAVIFYLSGFSQELKTKKVTTANFKEIFTVDKTTQLESGDYLKIDKKSKDTLISGTYINGVKSGIWRYFSKGNQLWMTYNFDQKKFEKLPEEISRIDSFIVKKEDSFLYEKVDSPPVYLGFKDEVEQIVIANFDIPKAIMEKRLSGISIASFVVDSNGKMKNFNRVMVFTTEVMTQMEQTFNRIKGDWVPAKVNGNPVESQVLLVYEIKPSGSKNLFPDDPKSIIAHFQYFGVTETKRSMGYVTRTVPIGDIDFSKMRSNSKRFSK